MIVAGIDVGSVTTKVLLLEGEKIIARRIISTGANPKLAAERVLKEVLEDRGISREDIRYIVSTGYGRRSIEFGNKVITEISAAAKGAFYLGSDLGRVRTVIDLGGQDSKVISLDEEGRVLDFVMNDRCSAGTGRFLEVMSEVLEVRLEDLGEISLKSDSPVNISSICTVFSETEVISLITQGKDKKDIIAGIHYSVAQRIINMIRRIGEREVIFFCGGGAKNLGVKKAIEDKLKKNLWVPEEPQFVIALGAAIIAKESLG